MVTKGVYTVISIVGSMQIETHWLHIMSNLLK